MDNLKIENEYELRRESLTYNEFKFLVESIEWPCPSEKQVVKALENSIYKVGIYHNDKIVGMGRMIGDMSMSYFIKDLVIKKNYQYKGVGRMIVNDMIKFIEENLIEWTTSYVELMSANGKEEFYEKLGFTRNPKKMTGYGMGRIIIKNLNY
ncbi:MAG: GNAT family N-acetyltransferase [Sarcina sp.]